MAFKNKISVGIIGPGKTGLSLAEAFLKTGDLGWILCRSEEKKIELLKTGFKNAVAEFPLKNIPDVIFITVRDSQISEVVEDLLKIHRNFTRGNLFKNIYFIHCSGALGKDVLQPLEEIGGVAIAAHPFQTFARPSAGFLKGIAWGIEADENDRDFISGLVSFLKGKPVFLSKDTIEKK
jgi:predicted short-subunit dehydrogenase-like oxidoreductase (DUF2520 family)